MNLKYYNKLFIGLCFNKNINIDTNNYTSIIILIHVKVNMFTCSGCGHLLKENNKFCEKCGFANISKFDNLTKDEIGKEIKKRLTKVKEIVRDSKNEFNATPLYKAKMAYEGIDLTIMRVDLIRDEVKELERILKETYNETMEVYNLNNEPSKKSEVNKCQKCGWLLSSKTVKCPRCGEQVN